MSRLPLIGFLVTLPLVAGCHKDHVLPLQPPMTSTLMTSKQAVFILMGQSNMLGAGMFPDEFEPVNGVSIDNKRQGPGYAAAANLTSTLGPVFLFQCAVGGSEMDKWKPGGDLYQGCVSHVTAHLLPSQYVAGIFFDQGESEAVRTDGYPWAMNFTAMVNDLRTHWPNVPVIYAQLGANTIDPVQVPQWQYIQDQQASVALPRVVMVSTAGLDVVGEHYTMNGYTELGRRMAQAYKGIE